MATRGKGKIKLQNLTKKNSTNKFENVIKDFKTKHTQYADVEPTITTLKNGKTKIEFKQYNDKLAFDNNKMLILDKNGSFERLVDYRNYGENLKQYTVYDDIECLKFRKNFSSVRKKMVDEGVNVEGHKITIERPYEKNPNFNWTQDIYITKSENFANVIHRQQTVPFKDARGKEIRTTVNLKDKIARQTTYDSGKEIIQTFKPGKQKELLPNDTKLCSNEQERNELSIMRSSLVNS